MLLSAVCCLASQGLQLEQPNTMAQMTPSHLTLGERLLAASFLAYKPQYLAALAC